MPLRARAARAGSTTKSSATRGHTYGWEPSDKIGAPVWRYPKELRNAPEYAYSDEKHGELRAAITAELERVMADAYSTDTGSAGGKTLREVG